MTSASATLINQVWPQGTIARNMTLAILGSLVVAAAAQVNVPMQPVPMTLQTLAVLAIGAAYGARLGAATLALYALEGAMGLPVFAEFNSLFKADGTMIASIGYVIGFIPAAWLVGFLAERGWDRNVVSMLAAMLLGAAVLYIPGLVWLGKLFGAENAIAYGLAPFWIGDIVKAVIAALGFPAAWHLLGKR
jgi:biotin transport system substrate-specific component